MKFEDWVLKHLEDGRILVRVHFNGHHYLYAQAVWLYRAGSCPMLYSAEFTRRTNGSYECSLRNFAFYERRHDNVSGLVHDWDQAWREQKQGVCTVEAFARTSPMTNQHVVVQLGRMHGFLQASLQQEAARLKQAAETGDKQDALSMFSGTLDAYLHELMDSVTAEAARPIPIN